MNSRPNNEQWEQHRRRVRARFPDGLLVSHLGRKAKIVNSGVTDPYPLEFAEIRYDDDGTTDLVDVDDLIRLSWPFPVVP